MWCVSMKLIIIYVHSLLSIPFRRIIRCTQKRFCNSLRRAATYCELFLRALFGDLLHWALCVQVNFIAHFQWSNCFLYHFQRIVSYFDKISCRCSFITLIIHFYLLCAANAKTRKHLFVSLKLFIDKKVFTSTVCQLLFIVNTQTFISK